MEKRGKIVNVTEKLPKAFILCADGNEEVVYISHLLPATLLKRNVMRHEWSNSEKNYPEDERD
jgi:hypothetical protein